MSSDRSRGLRPLLAGLMSALLTLSFASAAEAETATGGGAQFSEANLQFDFALGLLRRGLNKEAAVEFGKYLSVYPASTRSVEARLHRAEAFFSLGDYASAARDYYAHLSTRPADSAGPRLRYGICLYELGKPTEALQTFAPLAPAGVSDDTALSAIYYSGLCKQKLGDPAGAREAFLRVKSGSLHPLALYALAEMLLKNKEYESSADYFGQVAAQYPDHQLADKARLARANALRLAGKLTESSGDFQNLLTSADPQLRIRALYGYAWAALGENKPDEAEAAAKKILTDPAGADFAPGAHYLIGTIEFNRKKFIAAAQEFKLADAGDFAQKASLARAWALYEAKDLPGALAETKRGRTAFADYAVGEYAYLAGRCQLEQKNYAAAATEFLAAREQTGPRQERAAFELALALEKSVRHAQAAEAFDYFRTHFSASPLLPEALDGLGRNLMSAGRHEAAVPVFAALLERPGLTPAWRERALGNQAICYYYLKQYDNMAAAYELLLRDFPASPAAGDALFWLAWHQAAQKKYTEAAARYGELLQRYPAHALAAKARYYQGSAYLHGGDEKKAAGVFYEIALAGKPEMDSRELLWLGQRLAAQKSTEKAARVFDILLKREKPGLVKAVALRGQAEILRAQSGWSAARERYEALLMMLKEIGGQPGMIAALRNEALYGQAVCLREEKRLAEAEAALAQINAGADDPFMARLYFERGLLAFAKGEHAKAAENLLRVGLLVDDEELAGQALQKAGEACEKAGDLAKAQICYDELSGKLPGSFGKLYPKSRYTQAGQEGLKRITANRPK